MEARRQEEVMGWLADLISGQRWVHVWLHAGGRLNRSTTSEHLVLNIMLQAANYFEIHLPRLLLAWC